jgi:hypothetical protein
VGETVVQTEDVFRRANEEIADLGRRHGWRFPVPFLCECADRRCFARLELTLEVYEGLRSDPQRYLTAPGHEIPTAMVIEQTGSFALAEKL